jgi:hypothetical protein
VCDEGAAECGEYRQTAGAITEDLIRQPSYNGSLVVSATENTHAATAPTCDFCFGYDRTRSLRLHLHAETVKKITHEKLRQQFQMNTSPAVSPSKKKRAIIGRAVEYRSLKKLGHLCDSWPAVTREAEEDWGR